MRRVILYVAISLDGFIARENGDVDWLNPEDWGAASAELSASYDPFYASVGALIMGRRTYDQVLQFGEWPYPGKPCVVMTRRPATPDPNVEFVGGAPDAVLASIPQSQTSPAAVWLVGGADIIRQFAAADLIDEYHISVIPVILGSGIQLFAAGLPQTGLRLESTATIAGTAELRFSRHRQE